MTIQHHPVLVLTGPTATGKTATAIELARHYTLEIINGDSRLFYRGMDIGTAKPSAAERAAVPHHLIDMLDPGDAMSLAEFQDQAFALIREIHQRDRLPVIAGGTQQYINAVIEGWKIPRVSPQPELRARLEQEAREHGREQLRERLARLDPVAADSIGLNTRRLIRALEVIEATGRPISEQQGKGDVDFAPLLISLTMPRNQLYERIDDRSHAMVEAGLVDEVRSLLEAGVSPDASAFSSIGYRQVIPYLSGEIDHDQMITRIQHDTHRLVRHQETWLRKSSAAITIDVSEHGWFSSVIDEIRAFPGTDRYARS